MSDLNDYRDNDLTAWDVCQECTRPDEEDNPCEDCININDDEDE